MKKYNNTLNLPKTDFPMRAKLPEREPEMISWWESEKIYEKVKKRNLGKPPFILHDGPPYANGSIHLGHALNKVLKDIVVKFKNMSGFRAEFIPGWDTHGLPTEIKARKSVENYGELSDIELRRVCAETALNYLEIQRDSFKRLGIFADWERPYITLNPEFESKQIEVFAELARRGAVYIGLRPVYWCSECSTALAEAEIEYKEDDCRSIFVKFRVIDDKNKFLPLGLDLKKVFFVIWTTTAWTLPGNVAICINSGFEYSLVKCRDEHYLIASSLVESCFDQIGVQDFKTIAVFKGIELENILIEHPILQKTSRVILGDHVKLESGTGCVHTAPGHGAEDFDVCAEYGLDVPMVVDSSGYLTEEAGQFAGEKIYESNEKIIKYLSENDLLFAIKNINHKYPHCWRCKGSVIFRATKQWFCSVSDFKKDALKAVEGVQWVPEWGRERISSMINERNDWCISRQRKWGVPIPVFFCENCGEPLINYDLIIKISKIFKKEGSDSWFSNDAGYFLNGNEKCEKCGFNKFKKEKDIMDVWFDSGSSHYAVLKNNKFPADLYLEGADQYRGWFQSSLLTSVGIGRGAPYKTVLTHGWVVDENGQKQSKSLGNVILPSEIIDEYGADILRLWIASVDYKSDVRISKNILSQIAESYRKIRNTARFILGNLYDFNPKIDFISFENLSSFDKWILIKLKKIIEKCLGFYENFEFYLVFHTIQKFCIIELSGFYLDVIKDRLYVESPKSVLRRSSQTTMWQILVNLVKLISPIMSFTAEEIWTYIPKLEESDSVFLNDISLKNLNLQDDNELMFYWEKVKEISDSIKKELEKARKSGIIGSSLEADVIIYADKKSGNFIKKASEDIKFASIVSGISVFEGDSFSIKIEKSDSLKCQRCWMYSKTVGENPDNHDVCSRCSEVLRNSF
ncbi:MAG: isoleucine--tRNA ligase [Oscillospiraceae bacterium]|nr:isoleucine--tRNA ligase [Oscillospiraceae bacterium]